MIDEAELAAIRAADAAAGDFSRDTDVMFTSQAARHRRTLLWLLNEARKDLADSRRREQEARDAWVGMRAERDRVLAERDAWLRKRAPKRGKLAS